MKVHSIFTVLLALLALSITSSAQDLRDEGLDLYRQGNFTEAVAKLESRVATVPEDRIAWIFLAGAHLHLKDIDKASDMFEKARAVKQANKPPRLDSSVKVIRKPSASYTHEARRRGSTGRVVVAVEFRSDGRIGFTFPLDTTTDQSLVQQSLASARGIQFEPALRDGQPVTVINFVEYSFMTY